MKDEEKVEVLEEIPEPESIVEEIEVPEESEGAPRPKRGRKANKTQEKPERPAPVTDAPIKVGDQVRISTYVGSFFGGSSASNSARYSTYYVNKVSNGIVELKTPAGRILGSLKASCVTKVQ